MKTNKKANNMKVIKSLAAGAFLILVSITSVQAQSSPEVNFGLKAGVNFSTLKTGLNAISDKSGKIGFNAGVFASVGNKVFFQPEVNYVTYSDKYRFNTDSYDVKFRQLNVPLMIGYKLVNTSDFLFRVSAGPDLYYNLKKPNAPQGFDYKKISAGAAFNAGVDLGPLTLDARYSLGLKKVNPSLGQKTNIFSLTAGFKIQ
jgi:hypothetical protein